MTLRKNLRILTLAAIAAFSAVAILGGCSGSQTGMQADVYQEAAELTATHDSLEALAGNTGKTLAFEDYEAVYTHFLEEYPHSTALHRDWQSTMDAFNMTDVKIERYKALQEANPESAMFAYLYGRCLQGEDERGMFEKAIELDNNYFWGHFGYAIVSLRSAPVDTARAIEHLEAAKKIDKTYPGLYSPLASIYDTRGDLEKALAYSKEYEAVRPDSYTPVSWQVELLERMDRGDEALERMAEFAASNMENGAVRADLVEYHKKHDNLNEALKWQYEYVNVARDPDAALVNVAKIHLALDSPDSALYYLSQAAERGYADHRRVARNPELAAVREVDGFEGLIKSLKANAEAAREQRLAGFLADADENRKMALEGKLDEPAPEFAFKNLEGETVALEDLRGKVVVIDFWATWCGPCRMTMPVLQEFVDRAPEKVEFLSLNVWEDDQSKVEPYIEDYGYSFNVLLGDNQVASDYEVAGIPTMVVIDPEGNIQYKHVGYDPHMDQILLWQTQHLLGQSQGAQAKL